MVDGKLSKKVWMKSRSEELKLLAQEMWGAGAEVEVEATGLNFGRLIDVKKPFCRVVAIFISRGIIGILMIILVHDALILESSSS